MGKSSKSFFEKNVLSGYAGVLRGPAVPGLFWRGGGNGEKRGYRGAMQEQKAESGSNQ